MIGGTGGRWEGVELRELGWNWGNWGGTGMGMGWKMRNQDENRVFRMGLGVFRKGLWGPWEH